MHNKRIGRDDMLKIEVCQQLSLHQFEVEADVLYSGPAHRHPLPGASILAVIVNVLLVVDLLAVVVAPHLLDVAVVVISLLARMIAVTETTIAETAVTVLAAQTIGKKPT